MSLNHVLSENTPIHLSRVFPEQIVDSYQASVIELSILLIDGTAGSRMRVELKESGATKWMSAVSTLDGGEQSIVIDLPLLGNINELVVVQESAGGSTFAVIDEISLTASTPVVDVAEQAFVWSYGMLLHNWNRETGLVRDNSKFPSGVFDAIQATGALAAATAVAHQLGVVERQEAIDIVETISNTMLLDLPRYEGLWPHWVVSSTEGLTIVAETEWSVIDTVIGAVGLYSAQAALDLETAGTVELLEGINWIALTHDDGIAHGYGFNQELLASSWDTFGGESWLVGVAYGAVTGQAPPIKTPLPPTYNGSGFIDELAWLFIQPPTQADLWDVDWFAYRTAAVMTQTGYYTSASDNCFADIGLFGLSAAEVPDPSIVMPTEIYVPFGVGGRGVLATDGVMLFGAPAVVPHYAAMVASLAPAEATAMWGWLINNGYFSPLNNVESLMFWAELDCDADFAVWNDTRGSWNLALQSLGWGRYLAQRDSQIPILWQAMDRGSYFYQGYSLLAPNENVAYLPILYDAGIGAH